MKTNLHFKLGFDSFLKRYESTKLRVYQLWLTHAFIPHTKYSDKSHISLLLKNFSSGYKCQMNVHWIYNSL